MALIWTEPSTGKTKKVGRASRFDRLAPVKWTTKYRQRAIIFLLLLIAAGTKEILLLDVALILGCWAVLLWKRNREKILPLSLLFFALLLISAFIYFEKISHPINKNYFIRYYSYFGTTLESFFTGLVSRPQLIFKVIGAKALVRYCWDVFVPWLFLPFVFYVRHPKFVWPLFWIVAISSSFFSAFLADFPPLRDPKYHYILELWPLLGMLTVFALGRLQSQTWAYAWAIFGLFRMDADPVGDIRRFWQEAAQVKGSRDRLLYLSRDAVARDAAIVADELVGPWLASRPNITRWPDTQLLPDQCPDYAVVKRGISEWLEPESPGHADCPGPFCPPVLMRIMISDCKSNAKKPYFLWREGDWAAFQFR